MCVMHTFAYVPSLLPLNHFSDSLSIQYHVFLRHFFKSSEIFVSNCFAKNGSCKFWIASSLVRFIAVMVPPISSWRSCTILLRISCTNAKTNFIDDRINTIYADRHSHIWIGTNYAVVVSYDIDKDEFKIFGKENGLSNENISNINGSQYPYLWTQAHYQQEIIFIICWQMVKKSTAKQWYWQNNRFRFSPEFLSTFLGARVSLFLEKAFLWLTMKLLLLALMS
jgi:hypothetical protein